MSVSIYYQFTTEKDVGEDVLSVVNEWDRAFEGSPYESWTWYEVDKSNDSFKYEGATSLPMDSEEGMKAVFVSTTLLSELRKKVGGTNWSVNLDDMEFPWDEIEQSYTPNF